MLQHTYVVVKANTLQVSNKDWDKCVEHGKGCYTYAAGEQLFSGCNLYDDDDDDSIDPDHDENGHGNDNEDDDVNDHN